MVERIQIIAIRTLAFIAEVFAFALANEFFAALYEVAPRPHTQRCARCGTRFATDANVAHCGFCAVVVLYAQHEHMANLPTPNLPGMGARN